MKFKELVMSRYSCRKYLDQEIDLVLLKECIETARLAPSACNSQPWKFHIVHDKELTKQFVSLTQPFTKHAAYIVIEENSPNFQQKIVNKIKDQEFNKTDIGIACSYICLQASEIGLSTCMIGYFNETKIKKALAIPEKKRVRLIISIGYGDKTEKHVFRRNEIDEILKIH